MRSIAGESVERTYFTVEIGEEGDEAQTCTSFLAFAQQFFKMMELARRWGMIDTIDVYGESLVSKMARNHKNTSIQFGETNKNQEIQNETYLN